MSDSEKTEAPKHDSEDGEDIIIPRLEDLPIYTVDNYGFFRHSESENFAAGHDSVTDIKEHRRLESQWVEILADWDSSKQKQPKLIKRLCRLGIPAGVRTKVWQRLAAVEKYRTEGVYRELLERPEMPIYEVIERDIHRCYPDHYLYVFANIRPDFDRLSWFSFRERQSQGQLELFNVLKAYAHYNPEVGYCQGMGRLVGLILMQMPSEDAFWLLVATLDQNLQDFYKENLIRLRIHATIFESLLYKYVPAVARHLEKNDISPLVYITQWFLTVYTMVLPWSTVLRVWDMFYSEGLKVLHRVGLAIMKRVGKHLIRKCPTSTEIMDFLLHIPHEFLNQEEMIRTALGIGVSRKELSDLEEEAKKLWGNAKPSRGTISLRNTKK